MPGAPWAAGPAALSPSVRGADPPMLPELEAGARPSRRAPPAGAAFAPRRGVPASAGPVPGEPPVALPTAACACHSSRESTPPVGRSTAGIFEFFLSPLRYRLGATPRSLASLGVVTRVASGPPRRSRLCSEEGCSSTVGSYAVHPCHDGIKTLVSFPTRGGGKNRSGRGYAAMLMVEQATGCLT